MAKPQLNASTVDDQQPFLSAVYGVPAEQPPFLLIPLRRTRLRTSCFTTCSCCLSTSLTLVSVFLISSALFVLWPSNPEIQLVRLNFDRIKVVTNPTPYLDISLDLEIQIRNRDFFSLDYSKIVSSIDYRGEKLGSVISSGGSVKARGVSYVQANLQLDGIKVIQDVFYLIQDLATGFLPFETITMIDGTVHVLFLDIPINVSCFIFFF